MLGFSCNLAAVEWPTAERVIFGCYSETPEAFEDFAQRAKKSGATHIVLTAEDLPWARWQYDTPGDPYPAWAISNVGLLKIATPEVLKPYLTHDYAETVMSIFEARCRVLRKLGLKAAITTFEPQMLPEAVYQRHPLWRGPQVDEPLRSRVPRFAPAIDHPEVQALYRESIQILLRRCPEIEIISLHTNDSGSGISWSRGLYPGQNGDSASQQKPMYERYRDFFGTFQKAARELGLDIEVDAEWVREEYPDLFAKELASGMALMNREGPNGTRYKNTVGFLLDYFYDYYPARGIPVAMTFVNDLRMALQRPAPRLFVLLGDRHNRDLYFELYDRFRAAPVSDHLGMLDLLRAQAESMVGPAQAGGLVDIWRNLHDFRSHERLYNWGGTWFYLGAVQQRWLTRPFVPFPEDLTEEEKAHYRSFLFQARSEARAQSLHDLQSTRFFEGFGGQFFNREILRYLRERVEEARSHLAVIRRSAASTNLDADLLDLRLQALICVIQTCAHAVEYQYHLEVVKSVDLRRPIETVSVLRSIPERNDLMRLARAEIDNCARLIELIESTPEVLIDVAATPEEEDIRVLGPDLAEQLRRKIAIMIAHWEDHERLFLLD